MPNLIRDARLLADYLSSLRVEDFTYIPPAPYNHVGALLTDIILQAGLNYRFVVGPRVARVFRLFPDANTVSRLEEPIRCYGIPYILNWKGEVKIDRFFDVVSMMKNQNIETEVDFKNFLINKSNQLEFQKINGIGRKTVDYTLKLLCVETVAVDRHIYNFINRAGIFRSRYDEVKTIVEYAADLMGISRSKVDYFIWSSMSNKVEFVNRNSLPVKVR